MMEGQAALPEVEAAEVLAVALVARAVQAHEAKSGYGPTDEWINTTKPSRTIRISCSED